MARFLTDEGIYDADRLPTNAVLAPIAALYAHVAASGDKRGKDELLLKKYLWHAFFTDRYDNSSDTNAYADFNGLKRLITEVKNESGTKSSESDVPIFADYHLAEADELLQTEWPKRRTILGRAILAVICRLGAADFATGQGLSVDNIGSRHYHHVYPDALLKEADIPSFLALNCALINDKTNMSIGAKDPLKYLRDRYDWSSEEIVRERLQSHLIPIPELANGGYEGMSEEKKTEKLKQDFTVFILRRAELVVNARDRLAAGRQLNATEIFSETSRA